MAYKVKLEQFEGPFDLLVFLIESARVSIYDIPIAEITNQYIQHIEAMEKTDIPLSSEFIVLAAELIQLKSKMILPKISEEEGENPEEDPRDHLVHKLLEYKKFKEISRILQEKEAESLRFFSKPAEDLSVYTDHPHTIYDFDRKQLVNGFRLFLKKKSKTMEIKTKYGGKIIQKETADQRMQRMRTLLISQPDQEVPFGKLVGQDPKPYTVALTFSSLLEMVRQQKAHATQEELYGEIYTKAARALKETEEENV